ncbi:putative major facilitator superfamily transporter [Aureobasidium subglaciale]|nr:putative major facilitator superfamily transporter [Aureobasidium subglaciale]
MDTTSVDETNAGVLFAENITQDHKTSEQNFGEESRVEETSSGRSKVKLSLIMLALCMAVFLGTLDGTIVATALPTITEHFESASGYIWIGSAFLLANASTIPSWGKASDVFGRKSMLLLANIIFMIGSLVAALSTNIGILIVARVVQGLGSGGLVIVNIAVGDLFSIRTRGACYGLLGAVWAIASSVGPMIGGILTQGAGWRWCFWINLPLDGLAFILLYLFLDIESPKSSVREGIMVLDWIGSLLVIGATVMFLLGIQIGGETLPWSSPIVICLIVFGLLTFVLFVLYEWKVPRYPVMPLRLFKSRNNIAILFVAFIQGIVFISGNYYLPLFFQTVRSASPILSGVYLLPTALALSFSCVVTGMFLRKTGSPSPPTWFGLSMMTLGYGLFINLEASSSWSKLVTYQIIAGVGCGPLFQTLTILLQSHLDPDDIATGTATLGFIRQMATSISVVLGQVVFQNSMSARDGRLVASLGPEGAARISGGEAGANARLINTLSKTQKHVVHIVLAESLQQMWIMYTIFAAIGLLAVLLIRSSPEDSLAESRLEQGLQSRLGKHSVDPGDTSDKPSPIPQTELATEAKHTLGEQVHDVEKGV